MCVSKVINCWACHKELFVGYFWAFLPLSFMLFSKCKVVCHLIGFHPLFVPRRPQIKEERKKNNGHKETFPGLFLPHLWRYLCQEILFSATLELPTWLLLADTAFEGRFMAAQWPLLDGKRALWPFFTMANEKAWDPRQKMITILSNGNV